MNDSDPNYYYYADFIALSQHCCWKTFTYPLGGVELGSLDAERKFILARMMFPMVLIQKFTHNVACPKNRDLVGCFEDPIWYAYLL